jgi:hypothetical protein
MEEKKSIFNRKNKSTCRFTDIAWAKLEPRELLRFDEEVNFTIDELCGIEALKTSISQKYRPTLPCDIHPCHARRISTQRTRMGISRTLETTYPTRDGGGEEKIKMIVINDSSTRRNKLQDTCVTKVYYFFSLQ